MLTCGLYRFWDKISQHVDNRAEYVKRGRIIFSHHYLIMEKYYIETAFRKRETKSFALLLSLQLWRDWSALISQNVIETEASVDFHVINVLLDTVISISIHKPSKTLFVRHGISCQEPSCRRTLCRRTHWEGCSPPTTPYTHPRQPTDQTSRSHNDTISPRTFHLHNKSIPYNNLPSRMDFLFG